MVEVALIGATCCGTTFLEAVAHNQRARKEQERARDAIEVDGVAVDAPPPAPAPPVRVRVQCRDYDECDECDEDGAAAPARFVHDMRATFENGRNHGIGDDDDGRGILSSTRLRRRRCRRASRRRGASRVTRHRLRAGRRRRTCSTRPTGAGGAEAVRNVGQREG